MSEIGEGDAKDKAGEIIGAPASFKSDMHKHFACQGMRKEKRSQKTPLDEKGTFFAPIAMFKV